MVEETCKDSASEHDEPQMNANSLNQENTLQSGSTGNIIETNTLTTVMLLTDFQAHGFY